MFLKIKIENSRDVDQDTIDAFVSLGGQNDLTGYIDSSKLINIIRNEFQMTIDIEKLIKLRFN